MKSYIVTFRADGSIKKALAEKVIKSSPYWCHLLGAHWFIKTDLSAVQIRDKISPLIGLSGRVVVTAVKRNAALNYISNEDFIKSHL